MSFSYKRHLGAMLLLASLIALPISSMLGATKDQSKQQEAEQFVAEALYNEIYGEDQDRNALLKKARDADPENKAAHWNAGFVEKDRQWVKMEVVVKLTEKDRRWLRYQSRRAKAPDTVAGQMELADWCAAQKMRDQERSHLTRVIEIEPDHQLARRRLGFLRVDNQWISRDELQRQRDEAAQAAKDLNRWRPRVVKIRDGLLDRSTKRREFAIAQLREMDTKASIPALEAVLAAHSEPLAIVAVDTIDQVLGPAGSESLTRLAVFSPFDSVRTAAAEKLAKRPWDDFVPGLVGALHSPMQMQREWTRVGTRRLVLRHVVFREEQDHHEVAVLDTVYRRVARSGDKRETSQRAREDARQRTTARQGALDEQNARIVELNRRTMAALATVTRNNTLNSPQQWWDWWNAHNEVYIPEEKPIVESREQEEVQLADSTPISINIPTGGPGGYDCLAAGTKIWTETGLKAVEKIRVGDRVLAQHPESGELAYKPVLATTLRPASELVNVMVGDEIMATSGGHPFWVAGDGWVKARNLKSGARLHAVAGSAMVSATEKGTQSETYNLIVADFHTYFVGANKVLSHDNTVRSATDKAVPGLKN